MAYPEPKPCSHVDMINLLKIICTYLCYLSSESTYLASDKTIIAWNLMITRKETSYGIAKRALRFV